MRRPSAKAFIGAVVAALFIAFVTGAIPTPDLEEILLDAGRALGAWTYLLVGALAFAETGAFVGLVAPGETAVVVGGVIAGQGVIDPVVLHGLVWACAVAGDVASYAIGRRLGRGFLERHGPKLRVTPERLAQVERFFERRGGVTILIGRFIGLVRALAPFVAGTSRMPLSKFLPFDIVGAGLWSALYVWLGFVFWHSLGGLTTWLGRGALLFAAAVGLVVATYFAHRLGRDPQLRARVRRRLAALAERPVIGPLVLRVTPVVIAAGRPFVRIAASPAHALELAALTATALAGGFAYGLLGREIDTHPRLPGDSAAFDALSALRTDAGVDVVGVLTEVASFPAAATVALVTALWAAHRGRRRDAAVLVAGIAVLVACVSLGKAYWDRPRPLGMLVGADGLSYPSGHSAYATAYVACAVVLTRGGLVRAGLMGVAIAIVVAVAASRVYLHVHYLSDVLGGAALGLAVFAACGIASLIVGAVRDNGRAPP